HKRLRPLTPRLYTGLLPKPKKESAYSSPIQETGSAKNAGTETPLPCGRTIPKLPSRHNVAPAHPNRKQEEEFLKPFIIIVTKKASPQSGISLASKNG
ncbi:MAG TPA: hypothetical protein VKG86_01770, partial [Terracidiphilus sp.]|nr:hypothetical protein [Terracidiphilus sp.]